MPLLKTYLVEDSPVIREELIATLEELVPLKVVGSTADEADAVEWLTAADQVVDLVIVDLFLRTGSGLGVLRLAAPQLPRTRLVVLSNFADPDVRRRCLALGADAVFDKSQDIDALVDYCRGLATGSGHS